MNCVFEFSNAHTKIWTMSESSIIIKQVYVSFRNFSKKQILLQFHNRPIFAMMYFDKISSKDKHTGCFVFYSIVVLINPMGLQTSEGKRHEQEGSKCTTFSKNIFLDLKYTLMFIRGINNIARYYHFTRTTDVYLPLRIKN